MLKMKFLDGTEWKYDPMRVKMWTEDGSPATVDPAFITADEDCSKGRNQVFHHLTCQMKNKRQSRTPKDIRLLLGHACNFRCKYCSQKHTAFTDVTDADVDAILERMKKSLDLSQLKRIQCWGGEPLLYWKAIRRIIDGMREINPNAALSIVTNGSLMNREIADWFLTNTNSALVLSHDAMAQKQMRGIDPLERGSRTRDFWIEIASKKNILGQGPKSTDARGFSINPVLSAGVKSIAEVVDWYTECFGFQVPVAECIPVIPTNFKEAEKATPYFGHLMDYTKMIYRDVLKVGIAALDNYRLQAELFAAKLIKEDYRINPDKAGCFTTDPFMLSMDIKGNILPCQNFAKDYVFANGDTAFCGTIEDVENATRPKVNGIGSKPKCQNCPVACFCMGGCPYLYGEPHELDCLVKWHHYMGFLMVYVKLLFGKDLIGIEPME